MARRMARKTRGGLPIAVPALFPAIAEMGAKSAQTVALNANIEAADPWSYLQARTIRRTQLRAAIEQAEPDETQAGRAAIDARQTRWRGTFERQESEAVARLVRFGAAGAVGFGLAMPGFSAAGLLHF